MNLFKKLIVFAIIAGLAGFAACGSDSDGPKPGSKDITAFTILGINGTIGANTIALTVPYGTNLTSLTPTITITGARVSPESGIAQDFTNRVEYIVTAADSSTKVYTVTVTVALPSPGTNLPYILPGSISFNMKYVPGGTFPTGTGTQTLPTDSGANPATVSTPYWMAETEVTYELWYAVRTWARANGYTLNANPGREGNDGAIIAGTGAVPTSAQQEPVTYINWREAMVWCNALTEYYNANNGTDPNLDCVYYTDSGYTTPMRSADDTGSVTYPNLGGQDDPYVKSTANGFRLPGSMEWECAARYKDGTSWTAGSWASGGTGPFTGTNSTDYPNFNPFAWFGYTTTPPNGNTTTTRPVAGKTANLLGLRDMNGNVFEWCFDWYTYRGYPTGSYRVNWGGSWGYPLEYLRVGLASFSSPIYECDQIGFRFVRNAESGTGTPVTASISPHDGEIDISPDTNIVITFSEAMDTNSGWSVVVDTVAYNKNSAGVSWTGNALTINPASDFLIGDSVTINLTGFRALSDNSGLSGITEITFFVWDVYPVTDTGQTDDYTSTFGEDSDYVNIPYARSLTGPTQHATYISDYTTTDNVTGLIWKTCSEGQTGSTCTGTALEYTWNNALTACTALNSANSGAGYAGLKNWRLPLVEELNTLPDYGWYEPSIDAAYFPGTASDYYWSSSTYVSNTASAWFVSFQFGSTHNHYKTYTDYVRCVAGP